MTQPNRIIATLLVGISTLALVACGGSGGSEESAVVDEVKDQTTAESAVQLRELKSAESALIERVTGVAKAIEADPERAMLVLSEHDISADEWTMMLENIAQDPALSAAFEGAMGR